MKRYLIITVAIVALAAADLPGKTLIFPPAALPDLTKLGPARIETRWRPRSVPDGYFPTVEGYYVVYNHENLSLFFGPVDSETEAIDIQRELEETRQTLIARNSALSSSTVGRINIDFGGEPPTLQTDIPPEGLKPVRVLSGNSTLELGQEQTDSDSTAGSTTDGPESSDYGIGGAGSENQEGEPKASDETGFDGGGSGTESEEAGEQTLGGGTGDESEPGNPPGQNGILDVFSQGIPRATPSPGSPPGNPGSANPPGMEDTGSEEGGAASAGTTAGMQGQPSDGNNSTPTGQSGATPGSVGETPGETGSPGEPGSTGNPSGQGEGQNPGDSQETPNPSGQDGSGQPASSSGAPGSPPATPGQQPPGMPAPPAPPSIPSLSDLLKGSAPTSPSATSDGEPGDPQSESSGQPGQPGSEQASESEATTQEASTSTNQNTENESGNEVTDTSATESTESSDSSESTTPETSSSDSEDTQSEETPAPPPVPEEAPPTPVELELGETKPDTGTASPSSIHINHLLKGRLGDSVSPIPPDNTETHE